MANEATRTAERLEELFAEDRKRVEGLGRAAFSALKVYDLLRDRIVITPTRAAEALDLTWPTASAALTRLESLGIANEMTGRQRDRLYSYAAQLKMLEQGAGTPPHGSSRHGPRSEHRIAVDR